MKKFVATILLSTFLIFPGCALVDDTQNSELSTGIAHLYDDRPAYTYTVVLHFEDRPEPSAISKFIGVFEQIAGWPQAVVAVLSGPNRLADAAVGGSREEVIFSVGAEEPQNFDKMMKTVTQAIKEAGIDATVMGYTN